VFATKVVIAQNIATSWETFEIDLDDAGVRPIATSGDPAFDTSTSFTSFSTNEYGLLIEESNGGPSTALKRGWLFTLDGGTWARLTGEPIDGRDRTVISVAPAAFYSYGGLQFVSSVDGGLARGNLWELRPPSTQWVPLDDDELGVPNFANASQPPTLHPDSLRGRAVFSEPLALFDPVTLQWQSAPSTSLQRGRLAGDGSTVSLTGRSELTGATLGVGGWVPWSLFDGGSPSLAVEPVVTTSKVFIATAQGTIAAYDRLSEAWSVLPQQSAVLSGAVFSGAGDGNVLIYGGISLSGVETTGALYQSAGNSWSTLATAGSPDGGRADAVWVWADASLYVLGGYDGSGRKDGLFAYQPATNSWSTLRPPPFSFGSNGKPAFISTPAGLLLIANGTDAALYNRSDDQWRCVAPVPTGLANVGYAAALVGGRVVVKPLGKNVPLALTFVLDGL
jgi:hypothetical protein